MRRFTGGLLTAPYEFLQGIHDNYYVVPIAVGTRNYGVRNSHTSFAAAIDASNLVDPTLLTD